MAPVDNHLVPAGQNMSSSSSGTIPLSMLIDYSIQRTYHELTVLSELLPRKTDMERKIEIVQFASRTRQLFVRLLALVKWANSASKVDKCGMISSFLDNQAMLFMNTADRLAQMARETLVNARLPCFSLPCAIDVLTTGTYPRLPACIKERIVPPDPITRTEKMQTLMRLNQIIEHRLVTSDLPPLMRRLKIENGRVRFFVEHEFEVTMTLMGDGATIPWRLLDIDVLVEDPETGDGKSLVHSLQVNYIHQLVQSRLNEAEKPLHDVYNCLHSFCQSLQLEVLHSQAKRLIHQRLGEHVRAEEYTPGKSLTVSYWRDNRKDGRQFPTTPFKLSVHVDGQEPSKPLQVSHFPQIQGSDSIKVAQAMRSDHLSIEKLLVHTVQVRSTSKLKELDRDFRMILPGPCEIRDLPSVLYVPVIYPCMTSEKLCITINIQKGTYMVSLPDTDLQLTQDIEDSLNGDRCDLRKLLSKLRIWLALRRCERSVQHIAVPCTDHLPIVNLSKHPLDKLSRNRLYIKLPKQSTFYVVVEVQETETKSIRYNHYLLQVTPTTNDTAGDTATDGAPSIEALDDLPHVYLHAGHMMQLDTYKCTHGPGSIAFDAPEEDPNPWNRKRKLLMGDPQDPPSKKPRWTSAYLVPELTHILALCEDRIPFILLGNELQRRGIAHQGIQVDSDVVGLSLTLLDLPSSIGLSSSEEEALRNDLLSCKVRIQRRGSRFWLVESIFTNCPVKSTNPKECGPIHRIHFFYDLSGVEPVDKIVQNILDDWAALSHLYAATLEFSRVYNESSEMQANIEVKTFTYKRLTLAYGANKAYTVSIQYSMKEGAFMIALGNCGPVEVGNCHTLLTTQLQRQLNQTRSIAQLAQILSDTWAPMTAIGRMPTAPMQGFCTRSTQEQTSFTIIPQSPTHIRILFRTNFCIDVHLRGGDVVAVRDGAYSMFDTSKVVEAVTPIPQLKSFLNQFVDDSVSLSASRRRSTTEDDNPPSPLGVDMMDTFMSQQSVGSLGSPRPKVDGLRFQNPMTPPSNPHTPASPSTRMGQSHIAPSPSAALIGTPSPSTMLAQGSPNPALHVHSPGSFVPAPSPSALGIHMPPTASQFISPQGMVEGGGSPFPAGGLAMPSPGARNWPASPSMPGPSPRHVAHSPGHPALHSPQAPGGVLSPPSRMLPQRSWAASVPTLLSHESFAKLVYQPGLGESGSAPMYSHLERFLGSVLMRKHLQKLIPNEENLQPVQCAEPGVIQLKTDTLQYRISLNPSTLTSLQLKVTPLPEASSQWEMEELQLLEKYFELKVASGPYRFNTMTAFFRLLGAPRRILKDCINITKLEMMPQPNFKWSVQWCFTMPYGVQPIIGVGSPVIIIKTKILIMLHLKRLGVPPAPGGEPQAVTIPLLHDLNNNSTTMAVMNQQPLTQSMNAIQNMLRRFQEFNPTPNECSLFPAVKELMTNLVIPM